MKQSLLIVIATFVFCSCSTTYKVTERFDSDQKFIGCSYQELVEIFGAPSSQGSNGNGGSILTYNNCNTYFDYNPKYVKETGVSPTVQFFMDDNGECYRVFTTNTTPVKAHSTGKTIALVVGILILLGII